MSYQLPPDLEDAFASRMATGPYKDMEQVLRQALTALDGRHREIAAIEEGIEAMNRGLVTPLDVFDRQFRADNGIATDA